MRTIWKYPLGITDRQVVRMPRDAEILSVQVQGRHLCLWAMVDGDSPLEDRSIRIFGTGNPIDDWVGNPIDEYDDIGRFVFVGTAQMGPFVWHVFEERR